VVRVGLILPTFRDTPDDALEVAATAVAAGVDGVFCYDHLWPMGQPERPALAPFPMLAAVASLPAFAERSGGGPYIGTLVARVGLVPPAVLLGQFTALQQLAPGRVIAGLGTGDKLSESENRAYGIPYPTAAERRSDMVTLAQRLKDIGVAVWVAGGPAGRVTEAQEAGVALNLWDVEPALVAERNLVGDVEVTWAGPPPSEAELDETVAGLSVAGASWAVFGWPLDAGLLVESARRAEASKEGGTGP
jgi:alkanesulfonate monooxygenase SsuD/methylene tetrahydromethanopterin reductase-like flavin-dependent oxidoreductase (luciferase family)